MKPKSSPTPTGEKQSVRPRELMLFVDDELDAAQRAEIEQHLAADDHARSHVLAMRLTGSLLRERAEESTAADSIADLVMARIARNDLPEGEIDPAPAPVAELPNGAARRRTASTPDTHAADAPASRQAPKSLPHIGIPPSKRTANDNARTIWALCAVAVAAAAAFMIWGKADDGTIAGGPRPTNTGTTQAPTGDPAPEMVGIVPPAPQPEGPPTPDTDVAGGVEVATVDFGKTHGSVFYVPGTAGETTTVVWLADDEPGGNP